MKITAEQQDILESIKKYRTIKINAFAGTGKTTTLKLIASKYHNKRILYLAFNAAIKNEAAQIFPNNVFIKTTHGLAFSAVKKFTDIKLDKLVNYRAVDISKKFDISYNQALSSLKIFESFCNNIQDEISTADKEHETAKKIFDYMLIGKMKPTHGFYLKYYYLLLKNEQIPTFDYDIILLDEAQDTNEVTLGVFNCLNSKRKVFVGDAHQQIYTFRGSKNILDKIDTDKELYLSQSFRLSDSVAFYANRLLETFKNEKVQIKTIKKDDKNIVTNGFISRTNSSLISKIAQKTQNKEPFVTVRDPNEIFNLTCEVYYLIENKKEKIKRNLFIKDFVNVEQLSDYAKEVDDFELRSAIKLAKEYKQEIFYFKDIASKFYKAWENRNNNGFVRRVSEILFLSTAHTSKGLEWDRVEVADDFTDFIDIIKSTGCTDLAEFKVKLKKMKNSESIDEFNLFYVALTRAKVSLIKTSSNFEYLLKKDLNNFLQKELKKL
jgi:hypothetical protein